MSFPNTTIAEQISSNIASNDGNTPSDAFPVTILVIILLVSFIFGILSYLHKKDRINCGCMNLNDNDKVMNVLMYGISVGSLFLNVILMIRILAYYSSNKKLVGILVVGIIFMVLLVVIYIINIIHAYIISTNIKQYTFKPPIIKYFKRYKLFYITLTLINGDSYAALKLINSNLFGLDRFDAGISKKDFYSIHIFRALSTVIFLV